MREDIERRRRRLRFQARQCGTMETSTILGGFAASGLDSFSAAQLDRFEALLGENDADLLTWLLGQTAPPAGHDNDVFELILHFRNGLSKP